MPRAWCPASLPLVLAALLFAAPAASTQRYHTLNFSELDGLPSTDVVDIAQHADGSLWVAMRSALSRFDGARFAPIPLPGGLRDALAHLAIDHDGSVWIAPLTLGSGLFTRQHDEWRRVDRPADLDPEALLVDLLTDDGDGLLAVTAEAGVWRAFPDGRWQAVGGDGLAGRHIWSADVTPTGLVIAHDQGLSRLVHGQWVHGLTEAAGLPAGPVVGVCFEAPGRTWLAGASWIGRIESARGELLVVDQALLLDTQATRFGRGPLLMPDEADGLWLGTPMSLLHFDDLLRRPQPFGTTNGLAGGGVSALLRDRDGGAWFASARGLSRIPSQRFTNWDHRDGLLSDEVTALLEDRDGRLVIGHNDGLSMLVGGTVEHLLPIEQGLRHADETRVLELAESADGTLWMARAWGGLQSLAPDDKQPRRVFLTDEPIHVTSVAVDSRDRLWAGSHTGLWRDDGDGMQRVEEQGLPAAPLFVRRVVPYDDGETWLATLQGVWRGRDGRWEQIQQPQIPEANNVFSVLRRQDGNVYAGTQVGLFQVRGERLALPEHEALRIDIPVYSMVEDDTGRLWLGTRQGLVAWDGRDARHYGVRQGLAGQETNRAAALCDRDGRVWFGTVGGLSGYRREFDQREPSPPELTLSEADVRGQARPFGERLELEYDEAGDVTFVFHGLSFVDDGQVTYQAMLEGFDRDWLPPAVAEGGHVRYTGLPVGEYRLHVRARASRGPWSDEVVSPPVVVHSPWWQQPWFLGGILMLSLGLLVTVARQVGQRRHTERLEQLVVERTRALASAEQRYREMFDKNGAPQLLLDPDGARVTGANRSASELWSVPEGSLDGLALTDLLVDPAPALGAQLAALPPGEKRSVAARIRERSGSHRELEIEVSSYELLGRRTLHVTVLDVTERKRLEQQLHQAQKLESIGRLAGGVAHDFNNLLTAVLGQVDQARIDLHDVDAVRTQLDQLELAARRGARLTSQLLGFAREQPVEPRVIDMGESVEHLQPFLRHLLREDIELHMQGDPGAGNVSMDPVQLDQVLLNLVVNACDAMPSGGHVRIEVSRVDEAAEGAPHGWVLLEVIDSGEGMPADVAAHAFEPFFTTKPVGRGTGLGLATCHGIVARAGGSIELDSRPGTGTRISLWLPRVLTPATTVIEPPTEPEPATGEQLATVLLVEDEPMVREVAAAALERAGYRVHQACDGHDALARSRAIEGPIDLLLTDVVMPGMGGRELAERLLAERPGVAVLYASGYTAETLPDPHLRPGEGQLLRKPYRLAELRTSVQTALTRAADTSA